MNKESNIYILCVAGWEEYDPYYFKCNCSEQKFKREVSKIITQYSRNISNPDDYIDGYMLMDKILPDLCKKFEQVKFNYVLSVDGGSIYPKRTKGQKPSAFSREAWRNITKHNKIAHDKMYSEIRKEINNKKTMQDI